MKDSLSVSQFDMVLCLSGALDLIDPDLSCHHMRTAYITLCIARKLGLPEEDIGNAVIAAALHDIGSISLQERFDSLNFEMRRPHNHAETGRHLLALHEPFAGISEIVRFHHVPWEDGKGAEFNGNTVPDSSHILHLADRIAVLIGGRMEILNKTGLIREKIRDNAGHIFKPDFVDAFETAADSECFWLDSVNMSIGRILSSKFKKEREDSLEAEKLEELTGLFSRIIDFRSRYTATHSAGVTAVADFLAKHLGWSEEDRREIRIAANLHDIGKLAVPWDILEKPDKLTTEEYNVIKCHPYYTYYILDSVKELNDVKQWGAWHHERPDGKGYPFRLRGEDLPVGSRIMGAADVFTSIKEDRPYRKGMSKDAILMILKNMAMQSALDSEIIEILTENYDEIASACVSSQQTALEKYDEFDKQRESKTDSA